MSPAADPRARRIFAVGVTLGLALALGSLLERKTDFAVPADAVAMVNGNPIRENDLERALAALAADRRDPLGAEERRLVLDRLVEEELLVQRASELGLDRRDRALRARLVTAMVDAILADGARPEPTAEQVAAYYREHAPLFTPPARFQVRDLEIRVREGRTEEEARAAAVAAVGRLRAGEDFATVSAALGDPSVAPLPSAPIGETELRKYLGPRVTAAAVELAPAEVSEPIRAGDGFHIVQSVTREAGAPTPLAAVEDDVRAEMRRRADDDALNRYLTDLRKRATIEVRVP